MIALEFHPTWHRLVAASVLGAIHPRGYLFPHAPTRLAERDEPALPGPSWVRLRPRLAGLCGSDAKQVFLNGSFDNPLTAVISFPHVLGHEVVATVDAVGADVRSVRPGQRVVLNPWLSCTPRGFAELCASCRQGNYSLCSRLNEGPVAEAMHLGNSRVLPGVFADVFVAHESMCLPVPETLSDEAAVLADPFAVALHAVLKRPPSEGALAIVFGAGTLGLCTLAVLRALYPKSRVHVVARFSHQRALAESLGATSVSAPGPSELLVDRVAELTSGKIMRPWGGGPWLLGGGAGVIYDTVGKAETVEQGLKVIAPRGAIVITGVEKPKRFEWTPIYFKETEVVGSNAFGLETVGGQTMHAMSHYLAMAAAGRVNLLPLLTHRFPIARYADAFLAAFDQGASGAVKIVFDWKAS